MWRLRRGSPGAGCRARPSSLAGGPAAAGPPWGPAGLLIPHRGRRPQAGGGPGAWARGRCREAGAAGGVAVAPDLAEPLTWVPGVAEGTACLRRSAGRDASQVPSEKPAYNITPLLPPSRGCPARGVWDPDWAKSTSSGDTAWPDKAGLGPHIKGHIWQGFIHIRPLPLDTNALQGGLCGGCFAPCGCFWHMQVGKESTT